MACDTKERIIEEALRLFSEKGYAGDHFEGTEHDPYGADLRGRGRLRIGRRNLWTRFSVSPALRLL